VSGCDGGRERKCLGTGERERECLGGEGARYRDGRESVCAWVVKVRDIGTGEGVCLGGEGERYRDGSVCVCVCVCDLVVQERDTAKGERERERERESALVVRVASSRPFLGSNPRQ
jgi:hypothetical protein